MSRVPPCSARRVLCSFSSPCPLVAQEKPPANAYARAHYTKHEFSIPMRDGAKLFTSVYVPKDRSTTYPIMLIRTPYSVAPYGVDQYRHTLGPSEHFMKDGFIVVYQDVRGRYMSDGEWVEVRPHNPAKKGPADVDESSDTWDTIDWLVKNLPANNGKVGMWGISYPGFYVSAGMIDAHPALVAASPQAPVTDYYLGDDSFHNGAFLLAHNFSFYVSFLPRTGVPAPPQPQANVRLGHARRLRVLPEDGAARELEHEVPEGRQPVLEHQPRSPELRRVLAGAVALEALQSHQAGRVDRGRLVRCRGPAGPAAHLPDDRTDEPGRDQRLVMGPWTHGSWSRGAGDKVGPVGFGSNTSEWYREHVEFPFFARHLKGRATTVPEALMFVTGLNEWRRHETWPPKAAQTRTLYLGAGGSLGWQAPAPLTASTSTSATRTSRCRWWATPRRTCRPPT